MVLSDFLFRHTAPSLSLVRSTDQSKIFIIKFLDHWDIGQGFKTQTQEAVKLGWVELSLVERQRVEEWNVPAAKCSRFNVWTTKVGLFIGWLDQFERGFDTNSILVGKVRKPNDKWMMCWHPSHYVFTKNLGFVFGKERKGAITSNPNNDHSALTGFAS